ncbi:hypothetical protein HMI56_001972, partial [Coelomomyces lativittatus]
LQLLEHGMDLLQRQLATSLRDLEQLHRLKKDFETNPLQFIDDLRHSKLDIPSLQSIIHLPNLHWLLSNVERPPLTTSQVRAFQPIDLSAPSHPEPTLLPPSSSDPTTRLIEKRKARAARERERRRRKKELAILNGVQWHHIGSDGARISGVHYLQRPTTFIDESLTTSKGPAPGSKKKNGKSK